MIHSIHDDFGVLPLFIPVKGNIDNLGIGSVAAMLGIQHARIGVMYGAPDLFYQPLPIPAKSSSSIFTHEKWIHDPSDITPYSTATIFNNNLLNQTIEGYPEDFWKMLAYPLFLTGKIDESPISYFKIAENPFFKKKELIIPLQKLIQIITPENFEYKFIVTIRADSITTVQSPWRSPQFGQNWTTFIIDDKFNVLLSTFY